MPTAKMPKPANHYQRTRCGIEFDPAEKRTKENMKDECDINRIMAKFQKTGLLTHVSNHAPKYGNAMSVEEYENAKFVVAMTNSMYEELPSSIRKDFNGPEEFLEFVSDPENNDQMREMGLVPDEPQNDSEKPTSASPTKDKSAGENSADAESGENKGEPGHD